MTSRLALLVLLATTASGCVSLEMSRLQRHIAQEVEADGQAEIGSGTAMSFGWGTFATTRTLGWIFAPGSTAPYRELSRRVRRVKVARYPVSGVLDTRRLTRPEILRRYQDKGWLPLVAARDSAAAVWVLYRERERDLRLTDLLAVSLSSDELVMTRVSGDLSGLVLDAVALAELDAFQGALDETGLFEAAPEGHR